MGDIRKYKGPPPKPISTAPADGTLLRLWVRYPEGGSWTPLDDARESWTVGFNNRDNTEEDQWQIVGWCWSHDHLVEAADDVEVLGWLPFHGDADPGRREADLLEANNRYLQRARDAEQRLSDLQALIAALRDQSWDLRCFDIPTGGDDCDIGWRVVGHWMAEPRERVIAEVFNDDPAEAIRHALAAQKSTADQRGAT